jgi:hypothetical protein
MGRGMWVPTVSGPLASFTAGFEAWLLARGYSRWTVSHRVWQLDLPSRWLEREGLPVGGLTAERAEQFARARRAAGWSTWVSPASSRVPLAYLREIGVVPPSAPPVVEGPVEELLADYRRYLLVERGLAEMTVYHCERAARVFVEDRLEQTGGALLSERLSAGDVTGFLARECPRRSIAMARDLVTRLRSFLRFLHLTGVIDVPLVWAVPGVADQRDRTLPRGLADPGIQRRTAEVILAETGGDMTAFPTAKHLASWAGVCPGNDESAGKRRSGKTRKGSKWLRANLIEAATAASRTKDTYLQAQYQRLRARRGHARAITPLAHSMLVATWHILTTGETNRDPRGDYFTRRDPERQTRRLVAHLEKLGHVVTLQPATSTAPSEVAT